MGERRAQRQSRVKRRRRPGDQMTEAAVIGFCQDKLARYKIPKRIFFMTEFPLSASGKILKREIKEKIERESQG